MTARVLRGHLFHVAGDARLATAVASLVSVRDGALALDDARVFAQRAARVDAHEVELADGTVIDAAVVSCRPSSSRIDNAAPANSSTSAAMSSNAASVVSAPS